MGDGLEQLVASGVGRGPEFVGDVDDLELRIVEPDHACPTQPITVPSSFSASWR